MAGGSNCIAVPGQDQSCKRVISAGTVITGRPDEVLHNAALVIDGKTIEWVGGLNDLPERYASWSREA